MYQLAEFKSIWPKYKCASWQLSQCTHRSIEKTLTRTDVLTTVSCTARPRVTVLAAGRCVACTHIVIKLLVKDRKYLFIKYFF